MTTATLTRTPSADDIAATLAAHRTELQAARASLFGVLLGEGFIIVNEGVYLAFTVSAGRVTDPRPVSPQCATRFTRRDAERVAESVSNGNNHPGRAVHVADALDTEIAELDRMLAQFGD